MDALGGRRERNGPFRPPALQSWTAQLCPGPCPASPTSCLRARLQPILPTDCSSPATRLRPRCWSGWTRAHLAPLRTRTRAHLVPRGLGLGAHAPLDPARTRARAHHLEPDEGLPLQPAPLRRRLGAAAAAAAAVLSAGRRGQPGVPAKFPGASRRAASGNRWTLSRGAFAVRVTPLSQFPPSSHRDAPGAALACFAGLMNSQRCAGTIGDRTLSPCW